jgi:hypothetical protein
MLRDRSAALPPPPRFGGLRRDREPAHRGFAEPGGGDSDPCSPLAGSRMRVSAFRAAWRLRAVRPSEGPAFPVQGSVQWGG